MTPVAPAASAARTIAPRLPGSCTSTAMTTSAGSMASTSSRVQARPRPSATTPEGVRAGLIVSTTRSETSRRATAGGNASTRLATVVSARALSVNATTSITQPALWASFRSVAPSTSTGPCPVGSRAASRNRVTSGFWRLVTRMAGWGGMAGRLGGRPGQDSRYARIARRFATEAKVGPGGFFVTGPDEKPSRPFFQ